MQRRFDDLKIDGGPVTRNRLQEDLDFITTGDTCLGICSQRGSDTQMVLFFERRDLGRCRGIDHADDEQKD